MPKALSKSKSKPVTLSQRHIVAMGGAIGPAASRLVDYSLKLSGKKKPKVLLVTTATGDRADDVLFFTNVLANLECSVLHLPFFSRTPPDLRSLVLAHDVVLVGGGNTKSMLAVWREYGFDTIIRAAWESGIVLCGSSAGGICWFEDCITDSFAGSFAALPALGILKGSCCPHYNGEPGRPEAYHAHMLAGRVGSGIAIDECVGVHYIGDEITEVVSGKKDGAAYKVTIRRGKVREEKLAARLLTK